MSINRSNAYVCDIFSSTKKIEKEEKQKPEIIDLANRKNEKMANISSSTESKIQIENKTTVIDKYNEYMISNSANDALSSTFKKQAIEKYGEGFRNVDENTGTLVYLVATGDKYNFQLFPERLIRAKIGREIYKDLYIIEKQQMDESVKLVKPCLAEYGILGTYKILEKGILTIK